MNLAERTRLAGILLHPTSLPGTYGIGDLGPNAHEFVEWIASAGCKLWQVLPLGPTGYGNSPYQCHSVFAGNHLLISPEILVRDGFLTQSDLEDLPEVGERAVRGTPCVDFASVIPWKSAMLLTAFRRFERSASGLTKAQYAEFCFENEAWLDDFSLFMALKERHGGAAWTQWPVDIRGRSKKALAKVRHELRAAAARHSFGQMLFFRQWSELREHARRRGVQIIGDVPIFAAEDSSDVWAHPELFALDDGGLPLVVAGVPPDYFAPTGQLWGNPLYRWPRHHASQYAWWLARLRGILQTVDIIRLDHFRGYAGYWEIPANSATAETGRWVPGPAEDFLDALMQGLPRGEAPNSLPLIAEDLGVVTPDVVRLLRKYRLPGMRVLQFGFAGLDDGFLPHNYVQDCVVYTGTHDNDTTRGWFRSAPEQERRFALDYLRSSEAAIVKDMLRAIWSSVAMYAIAPMQDFLELGSEARMNYPGRPEGNWEWRLDRAALTEALAEWLSKLNDDSGRLVPVSAPGHRQGR